MSTSTTKTKDMVTTAMFVAIILAMSFVPYLGYIPLGFMNATIIHVPVIIGAILLGPARGAFLGGIFGLTSMINNTFNPNLTSFVFSPFYSLGNVHGNQKNRHRMTARRIQAIHIWKKFFQCLTDRLHRGIMHKWRRRG